MKKVKTQKGITIIALIITITILVILSSVMVLAIKNQGIIEYANNSASSFEQKMESEQNFKNEYINFLKNEQSI